MEERDQQQQTYEEMAEVMVGAAKEVCGVARKTVENPWTIGHEDELEELGNRIREAANQRNMKREAVTEAIERGEGRRAVARREREWEEAKEQLKEARRRLKRRLKRLERLWWDEVIRECKEACDQGRIGEMYKHLQRLGTRGRPAGQTHTLTADDFRKQFQEVSRNRQEEPPWITETAVRGTRDLREDRRAIEENEKLNRIATEAEIKTAIKEIRESAPGEDGV